MPVGNGVVLMGMSERTSRQAITQVAAALFAQGAAQHDRGRGDAQARAAMHLDTVFTFADRDVVTLYPRIMEAVHTFSIRPSDSAIGTGGHRRGQHSVRRRRGGCPRLTELRG